ncbi:MAG TPA: hypothetical protein VFK05_11945 [Polyangiaceae bacterium]|nr:hypothetical protein [Polyangiaceae bacterium]
MVAYSLLANLSVVLAGCDPGVRIEGSVMNEAGTPIHPAEALVQCPELCVYGVSDSNGRLGGSKLGLCSKDCTLTIRAEGYERFVGKLKPFCAGESRGMCSLVHVDLQLKRIASANSGVAVPASSIPVPSVSAR